VKSVLRERKREREKEKERSGRRSNQPLVLENVARLLLRRKG
jgi:hypothetical protein